MAWILTPIIASIGISYVTSEIVDMYEANISKPISKYLDDKATEAMINKLEDDRQIRIIESKKRKMQNIVKCGKLGVKCDLTYIKNDIDTPIDIIFINYDRAKDNNSSIEWSKKILTDNYFNKTNTTHIVLGCDQIFQLIKLENILKIIDFENI